MSSWEEPLSVFFCQVKSVLEESGITYRVLSWVIFGCPFQTKNISWEGNVTVMSSEEKSFLCILFPKQFEEGCWVHWNRCIISYSFSFCKWSYQSLAMGCSKCVVVVMKDVDSLAQTIFELSISYWMRCPLCNSELVLVDIEV